MSNIINFVNSKSQDIYSRVFLSFENIYTYNLTGFGHHYNHSDMSCFFLPFTSEEDQESIPSCAIAPDFLTSLLFVHTQPKEYWQFNFRLHIKKQFLYKIKEYIYQL